MTTDRSRLVLLFPLIMAVALQAPGQSVREVTPAQRQPAIEVRPDGTQVLRGQALPQFLVVQNFFIIAHAASTDPGSWRGFLDQLGLSPDDEEAAAIRHGAERVMAILDDAEPLVGEELTRQVTTQARQIGRTWRDVETLWEREGRSTWHLREFIDTVVRRQTHLVVTPSSVPGLEERHTRWQTAFEEGTEAP